MGTRWVITGCRGQLGSALAANLAGAEDCEVVAALDHAALDVGDPDAVKRFFDGLAAPPDVVVNAAAFTHVDRCEREPEVAHRVNAVAPVLLASACREARARLVHVSTDYVFAGDAERPYTEADAPDPRSSYGRTKLEGEQGVLAASDDFLVARTSWVYGRGRNFIASVLAQAEIRRREGSDEPLRVVDDQRGRPTYAADLAAALRGLLERGGRGLYHLANHGVATWWELARACLNEVGFADLEIERIRTEDLDLPAPRPAYSVLDCSKAEALGVRTRDWREAVRDYLRSEDSPLAGRGEV